MSAAKKKSKPAVSAPKPEETRIVLEGYGAVRSMAQDVDRHLGGAPSLVNFVRIKRIRITIEAIEEPDEVIAARVLELWETTPFNHHYTDTFSRLARRYGLTLNHETRGIKAPKRSY